MEGKQRRRRAARVAVTVLAGLLAGQAAGQEYGQWWWRGHLGYGLERYRDRQAGRTRSDVEEDELELALECNGYLLHPAVGRFSLGAEGLLREVEGSRRVDTDRWGAHAELHLFEQGGVPSRLLLRRRLYDYSDLRDDDPFTLFAAPDTLTSWEASTRVRRGPLRGLSAGARNTAYDLLGDRGTDRDELWFVDWSRGGRAGSARLDHRLRLERRERRLTAGRLDLEDLSLRLDERGDLPGGWRWELGGASILRRTEVADGRRLDFDHHRLLNRLTGPVREGRDRLELRHRWSRFAADAARTSREHLLSAHYRWRPAEGWELAPFGEVGRQRVDGDVADGDALDAARLGVAATWRRRGGPLEALLTARLSHGRVERASAGDRRRDEETGYGVAVTLEHAPPAGGDGGWRRSLEVEVQRDELDVEPGPRVDLPDLGLPGGVLGSEDRTRVRLGTGWHGSRRRADLYGEWSRDRADGAASAGDGRFEIETRRLHLGAGGARFQLGADAGTTAVERAPAPPEELDFVTAAATWRPVSPLDLRASWRRDERRLRLLPGLEGEQARLEATFRLGRLELTARAFRLHHELDDGRQRRSDGVELTLTRRFQGWLPVVTGERRRGVVR